MTSSPPDPVSVSEFDVSTSAPTRVSMSSMDKLNAYPEYRKIGKSGVVTTSSGVLKFKVSGAYNDLKVSF